MIDQSSKRMIHDHDDDNNNNNNDDGYIPYISAAERKRREDLYKSSNNKMKSNVNSNIIKPENEFVTDRSTSLVQQTRELKAKNPHFEEDRRKLEEQKVLEAVAAKQTALLSTEERAKGPRYVEPIITGWKPVKRPRTRIGEREEKEVREKNCILVDGDDIPPPLKYFKDMKIPKEIRDALREKGIKRPSPIQIQGLPVAFSGRDMVGIAFTGSGKTLTFTLPLVLMALGEEMKRSIAPREGPIGLILGPSRELMNQTHELVEFLCGALTKRRRFPSLRSMLLIGGQDRGKQTADYRGRGTHIVVATPGRLNDMLGRRDINLDICRYFCLDEGDRMMDDGFDEEVQKCLGYFKLQRQTLLFSATMPRKFVEFAQKCLIKPITVNVGRAGAANLDVTQEVEYVKPEQRIVHLLQVLQKTAPPVIIFCENKADVEQLVEYLLLKGVDAVGIHGGKSQEDRNFAIKSFKTSEKDVLVATDVAAKGLDFPNIQHVINFDMPSEIENYVHRIGRTGRSGKTGIATTFVNNSIDPSILLDLKHLLIEAKQKVPSFLQLLDNQNDSTQSGAIESCAYCGGPGHRITDCPKLKSNARTTQANARDIGGGKW